MKIFRVELETTDYNGDTSYSEKTKKYLDVKNGYIYVSGRDLDYVMENYPFISIEVAGLLYERPCENMKGE